MSTLLWLILFGCVGYLVRHWWRAQQLEVRHFDPAAVAPSPPVKPPPPPPPAAPVPVPAPLQKLPAPRSRPAATPRTVQPWQETVSRGAAELDRLVAAGDWDSAREALQRIAYGMPGATADDKAAFTAAMCKFAARDPLLEQVLRVALPLVRQAPGLLQSKLYPHIPAVTPELVRYALFYAAGLDRIVRVKKGNSYALFEPGHPGAN